MSLSHNFLSKLLKIEKELNQLSSEYDSLHENYMGSDFDDQNKLAVELENKVLALTHENASQIAFERQNLELLMNFIEFRKNHKNFSDHQLSEIIDNPLLKTAAKQQMTKVENWSELKLIQIEWNRLFKNRSYKKVKEQLRI